MPDTILEARNVGRRAGDHWLLRGASLTLSAGERLAIVGEMGSGKSVLLRALALLDPIDEGEVLFREAIVENEVPPEDAVPREGDDAEPEHEHPDREDEAPEEHLADRPQPVLEALDLSHSTPPSGKHIIPAEEGKPAVQGAATRGRRPRSPA